MSTIQHKFRIIVEADTKIHVQERRRFMYFFYRWTYFYNGYTEFGRKRTEYVNIGHAQSSIDTLVQRRSKKQSFLNKKLQKKLIDAGNARTIPYEPVCQTYNNLVN